MVVVGVAVVAAVASVVVAVIAADREIASDVVRETLPGPRRVLDH